MIRGAWSRFAQQAAQAFTGRARWCWPLGLWRLARGYRWWQVYLALLIVSLLVKLVFPGRPYWPDPPNQHTLATPRFDEQGPADGPPVTLSYRQWGDPNNPVKIVALHGSPSFSPNFARLGPMLADHAHVVSLDMPGFGRSSAWVPDYGIDTFARYTTAAMDSLGIDRAHLLGYSLGSGVALELYRQQPRRVGSLIFYGGIGIMEGEGSGDYHFEHFKYALGYAAIVVGFEAIPDFGLGWRRANRHAFIRSFYDTDQRPLRGVLEQVGADRLPMLILHDHNDVLVPADTAREHHQIVEHSELVMLDHAHMAVFREARARDLADAIVPFLQRVHSPGFSPKRRTHDPYFDPGKHIESPLPFGWDLRRGMSPWTQMGVIIGASYILEDPTTIFTGLMIAHGQVDFFVGILAIIIGIFTGDIGLYLIGYVFGRRALRWRPIAKRLPTRHVEKLGDWFDRHGWSAVLASRFIPGTRLPLYVSAGALGKKPGRFALWTFLAVCIWAVVMIAAVVMLGDAATSPFKMLFGDSWLALVAAIVVLLLVIRTMLYLTTSIGRARLRVRISKLWRWEFWPLWVFYPPVLLYIGYLALRHGGLRTITAVNPAMPASGFIDESKSDILRRLPERWVVPFALVHSAKELRDVMQQRGWSYPLILKPDAGQRGYGLRKINHDTQLDEYFEAHPDHVLAQTYHPGPGEAGVFYVREPDEEVGRIFSLTDKQFPVLVGDGRHTVEQLIYRHPRYRMQWRLFLKRHGDRRDDVLPDGRRMTLAASGNHCQGTKFLDGSAMISPALIARFDQIAKQYEGFHFGRFDVRYTDREAFMAGEGFAIVELNGLTSEATHIYDPKLSLCSAYRTLFEQWRLAFRIGAANRRRGAQTTSLRELWRMIRHHYKNRTRANAMAD